MLHVRAVLTRSCTCHPRAAEDECAFDMLYCVAFEMLDAQWLAMRASYMEFNVCSTPNLLPRLRLRTCETSTRPLVLLLRQPCFAAHTSCLTRNLALLACLHLPSCLAYRPFSGQLRLNLREN